MFSSPLNVVFRRPCGCVRGGLAAPLVCVCVCLSMSAHAVPPVAPRCVCVCHYPAGAALMEAVISNAVN